MSVVRSSHHNTRATLARLARHGLPHRRDGASTWSPSAGPSSQHPSGRDVQTKLYDTLLSTYVIDKQYISFSSQAQDLILVNCVTISVTSTFGRTWHSNSSVIIEPLLLQAFGVTYCTVHLVLSGYVLDTIMLSIRQFPAAMQLIHHHNYSCNNMYFVYMLGL